MKARRHAKILQYLSEKQYSTNEELAKQFNVSVVTIRRDLRELKEQNLVQVEHGGVLISDYLNVGNEPRYEMKSYINAEAKQAIALKALELIEENDLVILDSGTTNYTFARLLRRSVMKNITIVTGDLQVGMELCSNSNINLVFLGGSIRPLSYNSYGHFPEMMLENIASRKLFIGSDGIDINRGIYNATLEEVALKRKMIEVSDTIILMADSTKFTSRAPYFVCDFDSVDRVISDDSLSRESVHILSEYDTEVDIAEVCR